jgi:hypothetical protein
MDKLKSVVAITVVMMLIAAGGCASSTDRPDRQLFLAESRIELAEQSGARDYGALALSRAHEKLAQARLAADEEDYETAFRLALEAELDAKLAASQASRFKSEETLREINDVIDTVRRDTEWTEETN